MVSNGSLVDGSIVITAGSYLTPSVANQYDAAGNVAVRTTLNANTTTFLSATTVKTYAAGDTMSQRLVYDARNALVESDYATDLTQHEASLGAQQRTTVDADGRQASTYSYRRNDAYQRVFGTHDVPFGYYYLATPNWITQGQTTSYTADGQVSAQSSLNTLGEPSNYWLTLANRDEEGFDPIDGTDPARLSVASTTRYTGFDHAGNVTAYNTTQPGVPAAGLPAFGADYAVHYLTKDGYLEQSTTGTPTVAGYVPATDSSDYDALGRRLAVTQTSQGASGAKQNTTRVFAYDSAGELVQRRSGTVSNNTFTAFNPGTIDHYSFVNGQQVSAMDEGGGIHVLDTLTGFSSGGAQGTVVQQGDTLASIAQAVYGNSQLAYIVGDANGLSGDADLVVGQTLTLPTVTTHSNSASTFKPYDPGQIIGSTTPNLPAAPPPPSSAGCSTLATIVIVAVVVVASIYTAGVVAEGGFSAGFGTTFSAGASALSGGAGAAGIGAAAAGGAAGSVAGQLTGDALGVSHGFSFGQVLTAGVAAGLTAGIGSAIGAGGGEFSPLADSSGALRPAGATLFGAGAYASGVAAAKVSGQATHFSWAGLAASAVASGLTAEANLPSGPLQQVGDSSNHFAQDLAGGLLSGGLDRETSLLLGDHHVASLASLAEDAFGNALGNAAIRGIKAYQANQLPAIEAPKLPFDVAPSAAQVSVDDGIPQTIDDSVRTVQLSAGAAPSGDASGNTVPTADAVIATNGLSVKDFPVLAVTPFDDPNNQPHFRTPAENALPLSLYAGFDDQQGRQDSLRVAAENASALQASQRLRQRIAAQRQADGLGFVTITPVAVSGALLGTLNDINQLGQGFIKQQEFKAGLLLSVLPGADDVAQSLLTDATTPAKDLFDLSPVERAGHQAVAVIGIADAAAGLIVRAPKLISGAGRFLDGLFAGSKLAETIPEIAVDLPEIEIALPQVELDVGSVEGGLASAPERVTAGVGLRTSTVISADRAVGFLVDKGGFSLEGAQSFVESFDGPITARISRPSDSSFFRFTDVPDSTGSFLTRNAFATPEDAVSGLDLRPEFNNNATLRQNVFATRRSIVLEGAVANGAQGVRQTLVINRNAFQYGVGVPY